MRIFVLLFALAQSVIVLSTGEEEPLLLPSPVERIPVHQAIKSLEEAVEEVLAVEKFCNKYYSTSKECCGTDSDVIELKPMDCATLYDAGVRKSGIYTIYLRPSWMTEIKSKVYCDMEMDGGGWTVIQRRGDFKTDPQINFTRNWQDYSKGFGNLNEEFWLGNENIHRLTVQDDVTLRVDLMDFDGNSAYAEYDHFEVGGYKDDYVLKVKNYSGTAGDSLDYQSEQRFATYDHDNTHSCSKSFKAGWWYNHCHRSNLNGINFRKNIEDPKGITWFYWKSKHMSNKLAQMKIRSKKFKAV